MTSHFSTLDLRPGLLASLEQHAYVEMTPIQAQAKIRIAKECIF